MLILRQIKTMHDRAFEYNQITRQRAANDMVFYHITQWDDAFLDELPLAFKGEFNIIRKAGRQISSDLRANPVQIDFDPRDQDRDDGADILDGLYRSDDRVNTSLEAYDNAKLETVVCGMSAWELVAEYASNRAGNENQVIRRRPLYEANNKVFFDPNAKLLDKSDCNFVSILTSYTREGYLDLVHDLTGDDDDEVVISNFSTPEHSYSFPWVLGNHESLYVTTFYHREKVKDTILEMVDPMGVPTTVRLSDVKELLDDMEEQGFSVVSQRVIKRWRVKKYIASGERILAEYDIPGENIPVVPYYGERAFVEDEEHYEGITRLAKDPQRLRNFQMSYLADIVSRSPRQKPIFTAEQIQGYTHMYEEPGADNNYPYLLQNSMDANGQPLPMGPAGVMPEQPMPQALAESMMLTRQAVEDVANPGLPQDIADPDMSGKAIYALQSRLDQQSLVYQQNFKHAKRRDAEIYASMASEIYDTPRRVTLTLPDGSRKKQMIMQAVQDSETGDVVYLNDITNAEFDVYADVGPAYTTKKEQTIEQLGIMAQTVGATDPMMQKALILKQLTLIDGVDMDDIRSYARKQLVLSGFAEPESEEEAAMLEQAAQQQEPDPAMVMAQAEMLKGQADMAREQREAQRDVAKAQNDQAKLQVDAFKAQTDRIGTQIDAEKAGAEINFKNIQSFGQQIDNSQKIAESFRGRLNQVRSMTSQ